MSTKKDMIERQLKNRDIEDPAVLEAMQEVDRKRFVPEDMKDKAYEDSPLPIGKSQTISQPYIVAYMAQALDLKEDDKVLEVGTGCGYNAAVLSRLVNQVYSVEIIEWLADLAKENLEKTDYDNIETRHADGYEGWPEEGPFDAIQLTAAPPKIPETLKKQLKIGGKLLAPVGTASQRLVLIERLEEDKFEEKDLLMVRFVPMTGQAQKE
ncbi:protein-L-isoaspartate(D-aspartate) O-methyltransferase [Psychroflexus sediminis]|uniref:Protein-L-isoaspartate O-methyltransferase n=1 Tax=Psychroflexus sediminis TaxID=470826 RepID=A0A1G7W7Y1_9FLAO|nr:protein-L-isoaspartate(D-aspartate) O-methyltransferase [Psychroflexus sediminis]SDG68023.1 protein-L-isoaspartate(D-aspartate) O-methyltransferase [Psychroflexus sediminis]